MRTSHSRQLSFDSRYAPDDMQEILIEEMWTGPPPLPPKPDSWPRTSDRSSRTFLSTFSLPAAAWRPSPASTRTTEPRQPHYQTVSSSLRSQRRATVDAAIPSSEFAPPLPELPRRYSENATTLSDFPRPSSRIGGVKRKPVPALAIEDDLDMVEDPRWDGKANCSVEDKSLPAEQECGFEERVRSLSLEELFPGETGLGFLVKEVDPNHHEKQPMRRMGRSDSAYSATKSTKSSSYETDSGSTDSYSLSPLHSLPYASSLSSPPSSTRASTPLPFESNEKVKSRRPFALIRRRQSRPLEAHGSIIPSLAKIAAPSKKEEEDLMEAWMEIMVGGDEGSDEEEKPKLVFQSRPRKTQPKEDQSRRFEYNHVKPRPESIASLASILPPLRYNSSSRRSSIISLPPLDVSEAWNRNTFDVREDSEDGSEEFHDALSWTSDHAFQTLASVPESPVPSVVPPPRSSSLRFSPLLSQTQFGGQQAQGQSKTPQPQSTMPQNSASQRIRANTQSMPPADPVASKKRHSRSLSLDFLSSTTSRILPPRPPKSARRLSRPEVGIPAETRTPLAVL